MAATTVTAAAAPPLPGINLPNRSQVMSLIHSGRHFLEALESFAAVHYPTDDQAAAQQAAILAAAATRGNGSAALYSSAYHHQHNNTNNVLMSLLGATSKAASPRTADATIHQTDHHHHQAALLAAAAVANRNQQLVNRLQANSPHHGSIPSTGNNRPYSVLVAGNTTVPNPSPSLRPLVENGSRIDASAPKQLPTTLTDRPYSVILAATGIQNDKPSASFADSKENKNTAEGPSAGAAVSGPADTPKNQHRQEDPCPKEHSQVRHVLVYRNGDRLGRFKSVRQAARSLTEATEAATQRDNLIVSYQTAKRGISRVLKGKASSFMGFVYRYAPPDEEDEADEDTNQEQQPPLNKRPPPAATEQQDDDVDDDESSTTTVTTTTTISTTDVLKDDEDMIDTEKSQGDGSGASRKKKLTKAGNTSRSMKAQNAGEDEHAEEGVASGDEEEDESVPTQIAFQMAQRRSSSAEISNSSNEEDQHDGSISPTATQLHDDNDDDSQPPEESLLLLASLVQPKHDTGELSLQGQGQDEAKEEDKQERQTSLLLPSKSFQPSPNTVLIGKTPDFRENPGNLRLRTLATMYLDEYGKALKDKVTKTRIVSEIITMVNEACPIGTGFVKRDKDGTWRTAENGVAREKVGYTFRDLLADKYRSSSKSKAARHRSQLHRLGITCRKPRRAGSTRKAQDHAKETPSISDMNVIHAPPSEYSQLCLKF